MLSIAICDDQQDSLETIEEELHRSSKNLNVEIETHLYTDGNDMLGLMKNNKDYFDVVFLDIDMPKISGLDVAAKMRSINQEIEKIKDPAVAQLYLYAGIIMMIIPIIIIYVLLQKRFIEGVERSGIVG